MPAILQKLNKKQKTVDYNFNEVEKKWQQYWLDNKTYKAETDYSKPKYYVLDMFPYPSGAGLHVGHPLGYIASDIYARYKRLKGFNVLHPMGYDAYGLPAEQYAIQTGQHPAITTEVNLARYREQMDKIGFSFDWDREVRTCDPDYYKWTQWTFIQLFHSWFDKDSQKAQPISRLIEIFEKEGNTGVQAACSETSGFTPAEWNAMVATGNTFSNPYPMTLWVSDDKNHIPILAQSAVVVGSVKMELIQFSGLSNPFSSKIK